MNLGIISDESRSDAEQAARAACLPVPCDCLNDASLCPECENKLAAYDMLKARHRALSHGIASIIAKYGQQMPAEARGKLRVLFTEQALPELPEWDRKFWDMLVNMVHEGLAAEQETDRVRRIMRDLNDPAKGYAVTEDSDTTGHEKEKERAA